MHDEKATTSRRGPGRLLKLAGVLLTGTALAATLMVPAEAQSGHAPKLPSRIALPNGFLPEGIAIKGSTAYLGSRADGDIYAANLKTGRGRVISQGPGTSAVGLKVDGDKLYVSGGGSGSGRVVSVSSGKTLASYQFTANASFINDVVLTKKTAWFTDSLQPQLYSVSRDGKPARAKVKTLTLTGDWVQGTGNAANGITETPDGKALLVVASNSGLLFRVDKRTGVATKVDLGSTVLSNGDGLLLRGRTLYAVQNRLNQVAVVRLNEAGTKGSLTKLLFSAQFDVPSTVAYYKGNLYLPNARFTNPSPTTADYWVTRVKL